MRDRSSFQNGNARLQGMSYILVLLHIVNEALNVNNVLSTSEVLILFPIKITVSPNYWTYMVTI